LLKLKKITYPISSLLDQNKRTDIKIFWPLEGVEPLKLTQKMNNFANFLL